MNENRYSRQVLFPPIGEAGQEKIQRAAAVILGCGAIGTVLANNLCRAGVGALRIIDRDFVEESNLQRQALFTEEDARRRLPKAVAAVERLRAVNSTVRLEPVVADANPRNIESLLGGSASIVLDATDNLETRFLINDACVKNGIAWVYAGAVGSTGMVMPIVPGRTACFRCFVEELPPPGVLPTCDRSGILNAASGVVASLQSAAALRLLVSAETWPAPLIRLDVWKGEFEAVAVPKRADCPACAGRRFEFLNAERHSSAASICGRNMVQILPPEERAVDLAQLAESLSAAGAGDAEFNGYLLTLKTGPTKSSSSPPAAPWSGEPPTPRWRGRFMRSTSATEGLLKNALGERRTRRASSLRHSRPAFAGGIHAFGVRCWLPAFAGMTPSTLGLAQGELAPLAQGRTRGPYEKPRCPVFHSEGREETGRMTRRKSAGFCSIFTARRTEGPFAVGHSVGARKD